MTGPDRRPGCLYVVLDATANGALDGVEDHNGHRVSHPHESWECGDHVLEFPDPAAHAALEAELLQARRYRKVSHREYVAECFEILGFPRKRRDDGTLIFDGYDLRARCSQVLARAEKAEAAHAALEAERDALQKTVDNQVGQGNRLAGRLTKAEAAHAALEAEVERLSDSLDGAKARYVSLVQAHTSLKEQKSRLIDELSGASLVMTGLEDRAKESEAAHAAAVEALERLKAWLEEPESCDVGFSRAAALAVVDAALAGKAPNIAGFSPDDAARAAFEAWWATTSWSNNLSFIESPGEEAAARAAWKAGRASMEGDAGKEVQP